jgi:hypothetical protein
MQQSLMAIIYFLCTIRLSKWGMVPSIARLNTTNYLPKHHLEHVILLIEETVQLRILPVETCIISDIQCLIRSVSAILYVVRQFPFLAHL